MQNVEICLTPYLPHPVPQTWQGPDPSRSLCHPPPHPGGLGDRHLGQPLWASSFCLHGMTAVVALLGTALCGPVSTLPAHSPPGLLWLTHEVVAGLVQGQVVRVQQRSAQRQSGRGPHSPSFVIAQSSAPYVATGLTVQDLRRSGYWPLESGWKAVGGQVLVVTKWLGGEFGSARSWSQQKGQSLPFHSTGVAPSCANNCTASVTRSVMSRCPAMLRPDSSDD